MAETDYKIKLILEAQNKMSSELDKVKSQITSVGTQGKTSFGGLQSVVGALAGAAGFALLKTAIQGCITEAKNQAMVNRQLEAVLKSTKNAVGLTADEIKNQANEMMNLNGISDDSIQSAQNMLLTFTNIGKNVFPTATQAVLDMATAMNGGVTPSAEELRNQAIQLGKALQDPITGMAALHRVGVTFSEQQKEAIGTMLKHNDIMGAQKVILAELSKEFGGSAAAQATASQKLKVAIGELKEQIGTALLPVINKLAEAILPIVKKITDWIATNPKLAGTITMVVGGLTTLLSAMALIGPAFSSGIKWAASFGSSLGGLSTIAAGAGIAVGNFIANAMDRFGDWQDKVLGLGGPSKDLLAKSKAVSLSDKLTLPASTAPAGIAPSGFTMPKSSGGGASESTKEIETLTSNMKERGYTEKVVMQTSIDLKGKNKDAIKELGDYYKGLKEHAQESFDGINDKIKSSYDKIVEYKKGIIDLNAELNNVQVDQKKDIAKSYVESVQKIKELQSQANQGGGLSSDEQAQLVQEQQNMASAFVGLNDAQKAALQSQIDAQTQYNAMTDIEKIKNDYQIRIDAINTEIKTKTDGIATEQQAIVDLNLKKTTLQKNRMNTLTIDTKTQLALIQSIIDKEKELAAYRSSTKVSSPTIAGKKAEGGPVMGGSTYLVGEKGPELFVPGSTGTIIPNNQINNNGVNINISSLVVREETDINKIADALARQIQLKRNFNIA